MNFKISLVALGASILVACGLGSSAYAADETAAAETKKDVIVTVKRGDTLDKIAKQYKLTYVDLYNANKSIANPDVIDVGDKIRIPAKTEKLKDRFSTYQASVALPTAPVTQTTYRASVAPQTTTSSPRTYAYSGSTAGNTYVWGNCTWYVKNKRPDLPNRLGNGGQWVANAAARGYATGTTPRPGAVVEMPGHVAYVERVNKNGTIYISEMNYSGVGVVHTRTISSSGLRYIY